MCWSFISELIPKPVCVIYQYKCPFITDKAHHYFRSVFFVQFMQFFSGFIFVVICICERLFLSLFCTVYDSKITCYFITVIMQRTVCYLNKNSSINSWSVFIIILLIGVLNVDCTWSISACFCRFPAAVPGFSTSKKLFWRVILCLKHLATLKLCEITTAVDLWVYLWFT